MKNMQVEDVINDLQEQRNALHKNFELTKILNNKNSIHDFRLSIKKIRAIYNFIKELNLIKNKKLKIDNDLRELYRSSGNYRDLQVQLKLAETYENTTHKDFAAYKAFLGKKAKNRKKDFVKFLKKFNLKHSLKSLDRSMKYLQKNLNSEALKEKNNRYLQNKSDVIEKTLIQKRNENRLHDLRKHVKELYYYFDFIADQFTLKKYEDIDVEKLKDMSEHLGDWHDRFVMLTYLDEFIRKKHKKILLSQSDYKFLTELVESDGERLINKVEDDLFIEITTIKKIS